MNPASTIRLARRRSGLSLRELAELAGTSHATISAYEAGRVVPRADTFARLLDAMGWVLTAAPCAVPERDPRRGPPDEEFLQVLSLVEAVGERPRASYRQWTAPIFGRPA